MSLFLINNMIGKQTVDSKSIEKSQLYFNFFIIYFNTQGRYKKRHPIKMIGTKLRENG